MSGVGYRIVENARLQARNTFGVPARAAMLVEVTDAAALPELFGYAMLREQPVLVLGGGSNLLFAGDAPGAVLSLTAQRIEIISEEGDAGIVRADAGVGWHDFVLWALGHGLCGLENLALIGEQNQQLTRLVDDLRTLALVDAGELSLNMRQVDLVEMCTETDARFQPQAGTKKVRLSVMCTDKVLPVRGDRERLRQILDNLMQNALRYAPEGGWIKIRLQRQAHNAIISVHNSGPEIPEEAMAHLFERFYRADKARDRASGGTGLGLAIARKLAEAHGGTLIGENHPEGGVVFKLVLPVVG